MFRPALLSVLCFAFALPCFADSVGPVADKDGRYATIAQVEAVVNLQDAQTGFTIRASVVDQGSAANPYKILLTVPTGDEKGDGYSGRMFLLPDSFSSVPTIRIEGDAISFRGLHQDADGQADPSWFYVWYKDSQGKTLKSLEIGLPD